MMALSGFTTTAKQITPPPSSAESSPNPPHSIAYQTCTEPNYLLIDPGICVYGPKVIRYPRRHQ